MRTQPIRLLSLLCLLLAPPLAAGPIPSPEDFLGFPVGADRELADYEQITGYFQALAGASDRVRVEEIGRSSLGRTLWMAVISSPANLAAAGRQREIARQLADPRGLSDDAVEELVLEGKVIVLVTCNIHSTEIGASQMAMELAWEMATAEDPAWRSILDEVILLLMPSINPDGTQMVVEWYRQWLDTEYEGGRMPWLYHHYAGHDNNRDWFMLNLPETRAVNRVLYRDWLPQVYLDEHQMGSTGPRIFVPPFQDPIGDNIHPLIWRLTDLFGTEMAVRLQEAGRTGVIDGFAYDGYWPGGTMNTAWWKNVVGLLTEVASARMATPVHVDPNELSGGRKGLPAYRSQINFPEPWPGGTWRLRDIVDYERIATRALLETAARHRADLLRDAARMARDAVAAGRSRPPYAYAFPPAQRDPITFAALIDLLQEHGLTVRRATEGFRDGDRVHAAGTLLVPMDQPYRAFAKEMLERQAFPEVRSGDGEEILPPYDVTGWTLPLLMGVEGSWIEAPFEAPSAAVDAPPYPDGEVRGDGPVHLLSRATNASALAVNRLLAHGAEIAVARQPFDAVGVEWPSGTYVIRGAGDKLLREVATETHVTLVGAAAPGGASLQSLKAPRVGLYKPWRASMDEGWTRLVLERFGYGAKSLDNAAIRAGSLRSRFDAIVLPDVSRDVLVDGHPKPRDGRAYRVELPPDFQGGIGSEGVDALEAFVRDGGTLVALNSAGSLPLAEWNLPARDVLDGVPAKSFLCPGSILRMAVDTSHPLGWGLPDEVAGFFARSPAYATQIPGAEVGRHVVARYPDAGALLLSGFLRGEERLRRRAAAVELVLGSGRIELLGFRVQNRAWTHGTYRFLFNALERAAWADEEGRG